MEFKAYIAFLRDLHERHGNDAYPMTLDMALKLRELATEKGHRQYRALARGVLRWHERHFHDEERWRYPLRNNAYAFGAYERLKQALSDIMDT